MPCMCLCKPPEEQKSELASLKLNKGKGGEKTPPPRWLNGECKEGPSLVRAKPHQRQSRGGGKGGAP